MRSNKKVVVLGAGIAGIAATNYVQKIYSAVTCYEKSDVVGGLVSNFDVQGFRFDNAIHLSFSELPIVKDLFAQTVAYTHAPDAYCLEDGRWLKHPVQNNLYPLDLPDKIELIKSFIQRPSFEPQNYGQWLDFQYGELFSQRYPRKYTKKYWGCDAEKLSTTWIDNRMRCAKIDEILAGALELRQDNHYYAKEMRYPKRGGYFEFIRKTAEQCNIETNKELVKLDVELKKLYFKDGTFDRYDKLINSIPLPKLIPLIMPKPPQEVLDAALSLLWTTVDLISFGFNKPQVPPYLWFYLYDENNLASRGYSPSWKSPDNAPKGKSSLQFEIYNLSSKSRLDPVQLKQNITKKILEANICESNDILFCHHKHLEFGNVVFDHGMEARRDIVLNYLDSIGIKTCGRFGEWGYLWSDQSFLSGKICAENL